MAEENDACVRHDEWAAIDRLGAAHRVAGRDTNAREPAVAATLRDAALTARPLAISAAYHKLLLQTGPVERYVYLTDHRPPTVENGMTIDRRTKQAKSR